MEKVILYFIVVLGVLLCSISQLLLKKSANINHKSFIASILNWRVISAYAIFFGVLVINISAMSKGINLKDMPILESLGYVFVPLLSFFVLKEKVTKRTFFSIMLILTGIIIFYL